jgi:predicted HD superfamily hydrolase involved in NAD metabolism
MDRNEALEIVKKQLTEKRFIHTIGVTDTAIELAKRYGADVKKAELAAIFHDYAKYRPEEEMKRIIIEKKFPTLLLSYPSELWHAPVGAHLVREEIGIDDPDIYLAIYSHTTGRPEMGLLEKIIFLADYIEPNRPAFLGLEKTRELAKQDLDAAVIEALANTITYLASKKSPIYPDTFNTYNSLLMKKEEMSIHDR